MFACNCHWVVGLSLMPKIVARMLPVEPASATVEENCKGRIAARQQLANSSAIIRAVSNLVGKKFLISADEVMNMTDQEELRLNVICLLESMMELANVDSIDKKGSGAYELPNTLADDTFQSASVLKRIRFSRYVKAKVEHSQLQRCSFVTSAMSRLARMNTSLNDKMMTKTDSELMKRDVDTFIQKFEQLQNTTWKSANDLLKQQHSYGDDKTLELK